MLLECLVRETVKQSYVVKILDKNILSIVTGNKGIYFQCSDLSNAVGLYSLVELNGLSKLTRKMTPWWLYASKWNQFT